MSMLQAIFNLGCIYFLNDNLLCPQIKSINSILGNQIAGEKLYG